MAFQAGEWWKALRLMQRSMRHACLVIAACGNGLREDLAIEMLSSLALAGLKGLQIGSKPHVSGCFRLGFRRKPWFSARFRRRDAEDEAGGEQPSLQHSHLGVSEERQLAGGVLRRLIYMPFA